MKVILWDTMGRIIKSFPNEEEAQEYMDDCDLVEIDRNYKGDTANVCVFNEG